MNTLEDKHLSTELQRLECELHTLKNRRDKVFLEAILHPEFVEFGRSGRVYSRQEIIDEFQSVRELSQINTSNFSIQKLGQDVFLLTYLSSHSGDNGQQCRHTLRTSVWQVSASGPQLRFHQGTPTDS